MTTEKNMILEPKENDAVSRHLEAACKSIELALDTCVSAEEVAALWGSLADATCIGVTRRMEDLRGSVRIPRALLNQTFIHVDHALNDVRGYGMKTKPSGKPKTSDSLA